MSAETPADMNNYSALGYEPGQERTGRPIVSILLLNLNLAPVTAECLRSLRRCTYEAREVIVIDNGSTDNSASVLQEEFPEVRVVHSPINLGFTGGNNLAMALARGDLFLLLNNDTEVEPGFLEPLVRSLEEFPRAAAACPKIIFHGTSGRLQYAGSLGISLVTGRGHYRGWGEKDQGQHDTPSATPLAHGAAMLVRRSVVEQLGALWDDFFIYYEELDWSLRMTAAGHVIRFVPASVVYHKESMTVGKATPRKVYLQTRNRILLVRRNGGFLARLAFLAYFLLVALPSNLLRLTRSRQWDHLAAFARGTREGLLFPNPRRQTWLTRQSGTGFPACAEPGGSNGRG